MKTIIVPAIRESLEEVSNIFNEEMLRNQCPMKQRIEFSIALEELFINIVHYAYGASGGDVRVSYEIKIKGNAKVLMVELADKGIAYNPLQKEEPDLTLSADERQIGGLGIFMAKKFLSSLIYRRKTEENCLLLTKEFESTATGIEQKKEKV